MAMPRPAILAQVKLEDFFRSTQESVAGEASASRLVALLLCVAALMILLWLLHHWRNRQVARGAINHHGRLLREVAREVGLRPAEVRALRELAQRQRCGNPLLLLLCPSLLSRALQQAEEHHRRSLEGLIARMTARNDG